MKQYKTPQVVFVGRTNVGKSTLFNRLSVSVKSLIFESEHVTRDVLFDTISWQGRQFEIIDTGGISLRKTRDQILSQARDQALAMIEQAEIVVFVCDAKDGVVDEDREIAKLLHKLGKQVIVAVNKTDSAHALEHAYEFDRLGFKQVIHISALHGRAIDDLLEAIVALVPEKTMIEKAESKFQIVLLGKPNVGKSSLMNILSREQRSIVSEQPGTTREPIAQTIRFYQEDIDVVDTPGIRRKSAITEDLESLMVKTSFKALDRASIVLLLIDSSEGLIADQELKLVFYAFEKEYKAVIALFNKEDLLQDYEREMLEMNIDKYKHFFDKIPHLYMSCKTEKNTGRLMRMIDAVWKRYSQQLPSEELSAFLKESLLKKPLYKNQNLLHLHRAEQINTAPITIALWVNEPKWFGPSQLGFFERILRKKYDLLGVPIKFVLRKRKK